MCFSQGPHRHFYQHKGHIIKNTEHGVCLCVCVITGLFNYSYWFCAWILKLSYKNIKGGRGDVVQYEVMMISRLWTVVVFVVFFSDGAGGTILSNIVGGSSRALFTVSVSLHTKKIFAIDQRRNYDESRLSLISGEENGWWYHSFRWMGDRDRLSVMVVEMPFTPPLPPSVQTVMLLAEQNQYTQLLFSTTYLCLCSLSHSLCLI